MIKNPRLVLRSIFVITKFLCVCLLVSILSVPCIGQQADAQKHYDIARKHFQNREYAKALDEAEAALKIDPEFALALFLKSQALIEIYVREAFSASRDARLDRAEQIKEVANRIELYLKQNQNLKYEKVWREQLKTLHTYIKFSKVSRDLASPDAVFSPKEVTIKAHPLSREEPQVTEEARRACANGTVVLRGIIDTDGMLQYIYVVKSPGYGLTENSIKAARQTKFSPAQKDGRPVPQFIQIEYYFGFTCNLN